jgi:hypothetical protein
MIARRLLNSRLPAILALALASLPTALPPSSIHQTSTSKATSPPAKPKN